MESGEICLQRGLFDLSALNYALRFILQHSVKLDKSDDNAFKFIDKCVIFKLTVRY